MTRFFTTYWRSDGWKGEVVGTPIRSAGGTAFTERRIEPGSQMYVVKVFQGEMRLLGKFNVAMVATRDEAKRLIADPWDANWHLIAEARTSAPFHFRPVPKPVAQQLRFLAGGDEAPSSSRPT